MDGFLEELRALCGKYGAELCSAVGGWASEPVIAVSVKGEGGAFTRIDSERCEPA